MVGGEGVAWLEGETDWSGTFWFWDGDLRSRSSSLSLHRVLRVLVTADSELTAGARAGSFPDSELTTGIRAGSVRRACHHGATCRWRRIPVTAVSDAGDGGKAGVSEAGVRDAHHHPMAEAWKVAFAFAGLRAHRVHSP